MYKYKFFYSLYMLFCNILFMLERFKLMKKKNANLGYYEYKLTGKSSEWWFIWTA